MCPAYLYAADVGHSTGHVRRLVPCPLSAVQIGFCFSFAVIFQLITLPVEFNASSRALSILGNTGMLQREELAHTKKVLSAAAMTYVASAAAGILSLLRLLLLFGNRRRD